MSRVSPTCLCLPCAAQDCARALAFELKTLNRCLRQLLTVELDLRDIGPCTSASPTCPACASFAGVNKKADKELYNFPKAATLQRKRRDPVEPCQSDAVLDALIARDQAADGPNWLAKWERHRDNLPHDPTVASQTDLGVLYRA